MHISGPWLALWTGLLMLYRSEKYRGENHESADLAEALGLRVRRLGKDETLEAEQGLRTEVTGSVLYQDDGRVDPSALLARLRAALTTRGVPIREGVFVQRMSRGPRGGVRIRLKDGEVVGAGTLVLAAGAWAGRLARSMGFRAPLQPAKGYSLTMPAPEKGPSRPMILSEEKVTITPLPGHLRLAGTLSLSGFDLSVDQRRAASVREQVVRYLPGATPEAVARRPLWAGFRPASPDGLPMVGRLRRNPGVLVASGHGMIGITLGPVTGRLVADLVAGADPIIDPAPVDPDRF